MLGIAEGVHVWKPCVVPRYWNTTLKSETRTRPWKALAQYSKVSEIFRISFCQSVNRILYYLSLQKHCLPSVLLLILKIDQVIDDVIISLLHGLCCARVSKQRAIGFSCQIYTRTNGVQKLEVSPTAVIIEPEKWKWTGMGHRTGKAGGPELWLARVWTQWAGHLGGTTCLWCVHQLILGHQKEKSKHSSGSSTATATVITLLSFSPFIFVCT